MTGRLLFLAALALALQACAFPLLPADPDADTPDGGGGDDGCAEVCAGFCQGTRCLPAGVGEACRADGAGQACVAGARCVDGLCEREPATCSNGGVVCAGRCEADQCVPASLGQACNPAGLGLACGDGECIDRVCQQPPPADPVPAGEWLERAQAAFCGFLVRCDGWPASLEARCGEALIPSDPLFDTDAEGLEAVARGEATYDADEAGRCLSAVARMGCSARTPAACSRVFRGTHAPDAACTTSHACADGLYCEGSDASAFVCTGRCAPEATRGEECHDRPCAAGLDCVDEGPDGASDWRCRPPLAPGAPGETCALGRRDACQPGLYCSPATGRCVTKRLQNASCDDWYGCADGLVCAVVDGGTRAVCLPRREQGESCEANHQCSPATLYVSHLYCREGACEPLPAAGACVDDDYLSHHCDPQIAFCREGRCIQHGAADWCATSEDCGATLDPARICTFGVCSDAPVCGSES